jgi:FkbM family methyltransferase
MNLYRIFKDLDHSSKAIPQLKSEVVKLQKEVSKVLKANAKLKQQLDDIRSAQSVYIGGGIVLTRLHTGHLIYVSAEDIGIASHLMFSGKWEPWIESLLMPMIKPGMTVLDVGANHGYYTLQMGSAVGPQGRVYAFEANPKLSTLLHKSVHVNGLSDQVEIVAKAAYSQPTELCLNFDPEFSGGGSLHGSSKFSVKVPAVRIDDVVPDDVMVSVVKIDAEGSERDVLLGMERILKRSPEISIICEFAPVHFESEALALDHLRKFEQEGFSIRIAREIGRSEPMSSAAALEEAKSSINVYLLLQRGVNS